MKDKSQVVSGDEYQSVDDVLDQDIDDGNEGSESVTSDGDSATSDGDSASRDAELEEMRYFVAEKKREEAINQSTKDIQSRHKDFDMDKVAEYLSNLYKTDPQKAERLNNSTGFELVWLNELAPKEVKNDDITGGRNNGVSDDEALQEKIRNGEATFDDEAKALADLL
jgi:hypothetical protein